MASVSDQVDEQQPQPRQSLVYLDTEQLRLCDRLVELTPAQLEQVSNLPGWSVFDLCVHITRVCDSIMLAVKRATVDDQTPAFGAAAKPREDVIRTMTPAGWVSLQRDAYQQITRVVQQLSDEQLVQMVFPHPQGQRSIRWFCSQLLAEVTFHRWDLDWSLGSREPLDDHLAAYLLEFMLDPIEPLFGQKRALADNDGFSLATERVGWVVSSSPGGTVVERRLDGPEPVIRATPGWLALAIYGRLRIDLPAFAITGPADTADRFAAIFGPTTT